ncbi:MAG: hypothetical protein Q8S31_00355 [Alphaproteobacteria bacterium]|nr:hypothetical protein [Alphaproteobacteria bacterium]
MEKYLFILSTYFLFCSINNHIAYADICSESYNKLISIADESMKQIKITPEEKERLRILQENIMNQPNDPQQKIWSDEIGQILNKITNGPILNPKIENAQKEFQEACMNDAQKNAAVKIKEQEARDFIREVTGLHKMQSKHMTIN